jgi:hypothetical protein
MGTIVTKNKPSYILLRIIGVLVVIAGVLLAFMLQRPGNQTVGNMSPDDRPLMGSAARPPSTATDANLLVLPEGTRGFHLVSSQTPEEAKAGTLYVFNYTDGQHEVSLREVAGGQEARFMPVEPAVGMSEETLEVRGVTGQYRELLLQSGGVERELQFKEAGLLVALRSETLGRRDLVLIAESLVPPRR